MFLLMFRKRLFGQKRISAVIPTLEEENLHKNKTVFNYFG